MLLSELIVAPRLRQHWSSLDLGLIVARKFWWQYCLTWLFFATPVFIFLTFLCGKAYNWAPILVIWWLKPLFERPILYALSLQLFNQQITPVKILSNSKQWLFPGWLWSLTLRRLTPYRSFLLPVMILEGLKGKEYLQRANILCNNAGSQAAWLTLTLVHIEVFFYLGLYALIIFLMPFIGLGIDQLMEPTYTDMIILNCISLIAMALVAPFYVSCGFMLYICRRIELEAWDIEICFRDMAADRRSKAPR